MGAPRFAIAMLKRFEFLKITTKHFLVFLAMSCDFLHQPSNLCFHEVSVLQFDKKTISCRFETKDGH